jgi:hypothetical protein
VVDHILKSIVLAYLVHKIGWINSIERIDELRQRFFKLLVVDFWVESFCQLVELIYCLINLNNVQKK